MLLSVADASSYAPLEHRSISHTPHLFLFLFSRGTIIVDTEEELATVVRKLLEPTQVVITSTAAGRRFSFQEVGEGTERTYNARAVRFKNKIDSVSLSDSLEFLFSRAFCFLTLVLLVCAAKV